MQDETQDAAAYLADLQRLDQDHRMARLRTLALEFAPTLGRLPNLQRELERMMQPGDGIDYDALADRIEPALEQAAHLLLELDLLPEAVRRTAPVDAFVHAMAATITPRTVPALVQKFQQVCAEGREALMHAQAEAVRQKELAAIWKRNQDLEAARQRDKEATRRRKAEVEASRKEQEMEQRRIQEEEQRKARDLAERKLREEGFLDNGDGTVTDSSTRLIWKRCPQGMGWDRQAQTTIGYCSAYKWGYIMPHERQKLWPTFAGKDDWRVPTIHELKVLFQRNNGPRIARCAFPNLPRECLWSSSEGKSAYRGDSSTAWKFCFGGNGFEIEEYRWKELPVLLVRGRL